MTESKFTDDEIIKALNACMTTSCRECPLNNDPCEIDYGGVPSFIVDLINRLKAENEKQDKEIKKLKKAKYVHCHVDYCADDLAKALKENKRLNEEVKNLTSANKNLTSDLTSSRAKIERLNLDFESMRSVANGFKSAYEREKGKSIIAIQDFAERLKELVPNYIGWDDSHLHKAIDNLVKEMIKEKR